MNIHDEGEGDYSDQSSVYSNAPIEKHEKSTDSDVTMNQSAN